MKRIYQKPEINEVVLDATVQLLSGSNTRTTPPEEIPDYDDWFGARESDGVWDDEDDWEE
jgi:hypothetical protein